MERVNSVPTPKFDEINLGTKVTVSKMDKVELNVDLSTFVGEFSVALARELNRRNPQRFEAVNSQAAELGFTDFYQAMIYYVSGLIEIRLELIHKIGKSWQKSKRLAMTPIMQEAISSLGIMKDYSRGLIFEPQLTNFDYDIDNMLRISEMIEVFQLDGIALLFDAFPKMETGDDQTMSCVVIDGVVKARFDDIHPAASYISVFIGLKCAAKDELRFEVPYDCISFIKYDLVKEMVAKCFS